MRRPSFALLGISTVAVGAVASAVVAAVAYCILVKRLPYAAANCQAVVRLMLRESVVYAAAGLAAGIAIATAVSGVMRTLVFDVTPTDRTTYAGLAAFVAAVASVASYLPARGAPRSERDAALIARP